MVGDCLWGQYRRSTLNCLIRGRKLVAQVLGRNVFDLRNLSPLFAHDELQHARRNCTRLFTRLAPCESGWCILIFNGIENVGINKD